MQVDVGDHQMPQSRFELGGVEGGEAEVVEQLVAVALAVALAARGERGVADLLAVWRQEIEVTLALMGVRRIAELDRSLIET